MKKLYLLITAILFSTYVFGQIKEFNTQFRRTNNDYSSKTLYQKLDSTITKKYVSTSQSFEFYSKNEHSYDSLFRNDVVKIHSWDELSLAWDYYHLDKLTFNENSSVNEYLYCSYLTNNGQCNKHIMTYYDSGEVDSTYQFHYDSISSQWLSMGIGNQIFNDESLLFSKTNLSWYLNSTSISYGSKHEILYDENQREKQTTFFTFNATSLAWDTLNKVLCEFNGNVKESTNYEYNTTSNSWSTQGKIVETYNSDSLVTIVIAYNWSNNNWVESNKAINDYDNFNNLIRKTYQTWNENTSQWDNTTKYELFFDYNYTSNQLIEYLQSSEIASNYLNNFLGYNHKLDYYTINTWTNNSWFVRDTTTFYYSGQIVSIDNSTSNNNLKVYPNPACDYLILEDDQNFTFELYDTNGKLVSSEYILKSKKVNINLNNGLYFYRVITCDNILNGKIVISK